MLICQVSRLDLRLGCDHQSGLRFQQSFAKNTGLYSERVGALHVISPTPEEAYRVQRQIVVLQRREISTPPGHGARLVSGLQMHTIRLSHRKLGFLDIERSGSV
jgi:aspartate/tyrosine/aromatic aminotransferase